MSQIKVKEIKMATIQMVGNKTRGEGLSAATTLAAVSDSRDFMTKLMEKSFTMDDLKHFSYVESVELNPVYQFVSKIFDDNESFLKQSVNIATFLYDQSLHPNIRNGELYVLLAQCEYKKQLVDTVAILKSEKKDPFLATDNDGMEITAKSMYGTGLKGLDKGCLVLNIERENGYVVGTVDNVNNGTDAQYWTDSFLHVTNCDDDYHQTAKLTEMLTDYSKLVKEKSVMEGAIVAKKAVELLKKEGVVRIEELADKLFDADEQKRDFENYRRSYEEENGGFTEEVTVVAKAASRKPVTRMNVLRLGCDFEVKVLNPNAEIEKGVDKASGKEYYTLYFSK